MFLMIYADGPIGVLWSLIANARPISEIYLNLSLCGSL